MAEHSLRAAGGIVELDSKLAMNDLAFKISGFATYRRTAAALRARRASPGSRSPSALTFKSSSRLARPAANIVLLIPLHVVDGRVLIAHQER